jgi:cell wall-associated NlpC family hydrolase
MNYGIEQIYQAALSAGFTPDQATTWTAIALAESGGRVDALNDQGEHSVGLWQINLDAHEDRWGDLTDPYNNARAAYEISHGGTDMRPWTTTHASRQGTASDYRMYLPQVSQVTGYAGDGRGVGGYGSPLPEALPDSQPVVATMATSVTDGAGTAPEVDLLTDPGSSLDTDRDGLTDAFERMVGSSSDLADTDADGLSDAYETVVTGTDVLSADTDDDTLTDATEVALGTSAVTWDTDLDGASDGAEATYGTDPLLAPPGSTPLPPAPPAAPVAPPDGSITTVAATTTASTTGASLGTGGTLVDAFVQTALAQEGDSYVFGAEAGLDEVDPDTFDCSELTQWAADQVGVTIPDGAMYQYLELKQQEQLLSVEEALQTPGALLFYFSEEPTADGGRPSSAHVAISLGDGRTIEARGSDYGVMVVGAEENQGRFNYAGVVPEMAGAAPAPAGLLTTAAGVDGAVDAGAPLDPDADDDGLSDAFERLLGLDPFSADTDKDGRSDAEEHLAGDEEMSRQQVTAALTEQGLVGSEDADSDGLSNRFEIKHGLDVHEADSDADGLADNVEVALGTSATKLDTDADGLTDLMEVELGTDPLTAGNPTDGWGLPTEDVPDPGLVGQPVGAMDEGADLG